MRILKRNLAFMLALVMALGLMTTANAADVEDYTDYNDITYVEAVDVLTALGVLEGTDGTFAPTDTLTREQGAKIVAYLMLGADAADALTTSAAPFNDVPAARWSAGYIAYCVSQNIIGGYGDGNFGPEDTLTANQFAKMLLCALGYNANAELTGTNWEIETSKTALTEGVFEGNLGANFSAGVSREEAALYAFNTLTGVMTVSYSDVFGTYYSGKLFNSSEDFNEEYTLGYKLYNLTSKDATDDFGRACHYWAKKSSKITGTYHEEADATYTVSTKAGTIYSDLGLTSTVEATVIRNGVELDDTFQLKKGLTSILTGSTVANGGFLAGNGVVVEAYMDDDDESVTLIVIDTYLAQVASVDEGEVEVDDIYGDADIDDYTFETAVEYEEDDYVLITVADGTIQSMAAADIENGEISIYADGYVTLESTKYNKTQMLKNNDTESDDAFYDVDYESTMAVILDQYGYVIGVIVEDEAESDYHYVLVTASEGKASSLLSNSAAVVEVMYLDGTTEVLALPTKKDGTDIYYKIDSEWVEITWDDTDTLVDADNKDVKGFYRYSINDDGEIILKALDKDYAIGEVGADINYSYSKTGTLYASGDTGETDNLLSGYYMNSSTVYHIVEDDDTIKTYTSYKNITISEDPANVLAVVDGSIITDLYILDTEVTESALYAYYNGTYYNTSNGTYVTLYVDGSAVNYIYDLYTADDPDTTDVDEESGTAVSDLSTGLYTIDVSDGELTDMDIQKTYKTGKEKVTSAQDLYFKTASGNHYYDDDVEIYDITDDGAEATIARSDYVVWIEDANDLIIYACIVTTPDTTTTDDTDSTSDYTVTATKTSTNVTFAVSDLTDEEVTVTVYNYASGINAELTTITLSEDIVDKTLTETLTSDIDWTGAAGTYQLSFSVYVDGDLVNTFGPYSFTIQP